jgi:Ca2+-binding EF-hand superfamily protein
MTRIISLVTACAVILFTHSALQAEDSQEAKKESAFQRYDKNSDGSVSKEEFMSSKGAEKDPERAEKKFASMDKDGNGSLSKEEFTKAPGGEKKAGGKKGEEGKNSTGSGESGE